MISPGAIPLGAALNQTLLGAMGPDVFMNDFSRTEWSDGYFGMLGRALVFATRFEASVRSLSTLLDLRGSPDALDSQQRMEELLDAARKKGLAKHIKRVGLDEGEFSETLRIAREARNEVAHDLGLGLDRCLDLLPAPDMEKVEERLRELSLFLARGDWIACMLISILTEEHRPTGNYLNEYPERVANWVCERLKGNQ